MRVGTEVTLYQPKEGMFMIVVKSNGHYRTRHDDMRLAPRNEWAKIIENDIAEIEFRIDMDIEEESEDGSEDGD